MSFEAVQAYMRSEKIDGWLLHDFRGSNQIFTRMVGAKKHLSRRTQLLIPAQGTPHVIVQHLDAPQFNDLSFGGQPVKKTVFISWPDLRRTMESALSGMKRVAMEYSPGGALPIIAIVDAGTVELVRSFGVEVVSSANLIQVHVAKWPVSSLPNHALACQQVDAAKNSAFALIDERIKSGAPVTEFEVQKLIVGEFNRQGLEFPDPPIVAANAHAGDPHHETNAKSSVALERGDWVLIDLWARRPGDDNIYCDVTWTGYVRKNAGDRPSDKHLSVYHAVQAARDASVSLAQSKWKAGEAVQGWQLDEAARQKIIAAGYGEFIRHRTGHSLSPGPMVHGVGMNLDNLETHDTREMLPGIGFTVEPGIYLPEFGVRNEINVYVDPTKGPIVTSVAQREPIMVG